MKSSTAIQKLPEFQIGDLAVSYSGMIILITAVFYDELTGVVLFTRDNKNVSIGLHSAWRQEDFQLFTGQIILEN